MSEDAEETDVSTQDNDVSAQETDVSADEEGGMPATDDRTETVGEGPATSTGETRGQAAEIEDAAESFLEIESEFDAGALPGQVRGQAVDARQVPASTVPADYPIEIETEQAIALSVAVDDQQVPVYFAFDETADGHIGRLLKLNEIPPDQFADLYGESVLLTAEDGHYVPAIPEEFPHGSPLGVYGVGGGLAVNLLVIALLIVGLGGVFSVPVVFAWLAANIIGVPAATYLDAWHLRTHTDWDGGPLFWTALGAIPGLNVLSSAAYLRERARTTDL